MRRAAPSLAAFGVALALLAGCGEKDEPVVTGPVEPTTPTTADDVSSPAELVGQVVADFLTSDDAAAVCDDEITERFLRASYGDRAGCISGRRPATLASLATVPDPVVDGATATARATPSGGDFDGQRLSFELVREGGRWRIDTVDARNPIGP